MLGACITYVTVTIFNDFCPVPTTFPLLERCRYPEDWHEKAMAHGNLNYIQVQFPAPSFSLPCNIMENSNKLHTTWIYIRINVLNILFLL